LARTSSAERELCSASFLTSPATTRKPSPCCPARAASTRGVERQQVGLARDARDAVHQLPDLARLLVEHRGHVGGVIHVDHQFMSSVLALATSSRGDAPGERSP